ncbi:MULTISPECIES: protocatechuate 3,4-dioxygenase subunit alpha [Burkholderia]|uniref:protocatechuate 3,4-dioxygenase subunit alpha n=1 Tax=Burkholderia TaxID=32008 RepID=UPI000841D508|nr:MULTISPECIES: protocatechuate 3,4-dioxygenase subunit alpha [unclassified Burkholderia]AOK32014.1 protocatechuate 3,4-dioxygenase subunit alpha [Burkholderia sp. Bp7605]
MTPPKLKQTPSQTVGPYFAYGLCPRQYGYDLESLFEPALATPDAAGEHIVVIGQVLDGDGKPVNDALLEFTQADGDGHYPTSRDDVRQSGFRGFARIGTGTDPHHRFVVHTVKPGRTSETDAPHVDVTVMMRGVLTHAFTRIYFDDEAAANAADATLARVPADRRATLIARREPDTAARRAAVYRFDVRMQGELETVFFDI